MKIKAVMAGALMFVAGAAVAQVQPSAETATSPETKPAVRELENPDKIRCERMAVTGSRLGGKVCHTEAEWALIDRRADELMRDLGNKFVAPKDPLRNTSKFNYPDAVGL